MKDIKFDLTENCGNVSAKNSNFRIRKNPNMGRRMGPQGRRMHAYMQNEVDEYMNNNDKIMEKIGVKEHFR